MNHKVITYILGWVLKIEAACMLLPLIFSAVYGEQSAIYAFVVCASACLAAGTLLTLRQPENKSMYSREGFVTVALSWIVISIFGAFPFVLSGSIPNYVDALFETASGFTTTGASILTDVEALPKGMLLWRSLTHWLGGMGVLVFLVAILPLSGSNNFHLLRAESPGPSVSKLVPKIKSTAKLLYIIYIVFTVCEAVLLLIGGLSLFEALTLTFGTVGTGGFAILNAGLAPYSAYVQIVITVFMFMCGIDFSLYHLIYLRKGKSLLHSDELKAYVSIILIAAALIFVNCHSLFASVGEALRHVFFQVVSLMTSTGYSTTDFDLWPQLSKTILITLMFIGACAGSTGGGIKVSRILILLKSIVKEVKIGAHPKSTMKIKMNGRAVEHETVRAVNVFIAAYFSIFALSLIVISIDNFDFTTCFSSVVTTLGNMGPGFSLVGPTRNFSIYSPISKIVLTLDMLIGRLEIFPILILFSPYTWKK